MKRSATGPLRTARGGGDIAFGLQVKEGLPYEIPLRDLCTSTGAPVKIESVSLWRPTGDLRIVDWGVRVVSPDHPGGPNIGAEQMTVAQVGGFSTGPVTAKCGPRTATTVQQFYVSLATTRTRSTAAGVTIRYEPGKRLHQKYGLALCLTDPDCAYGLDKHDD